MDIVDLITRNGFSLKRVSSASREYAGPCPFCGGKLKVNKNSTLDSLKICEHCGSEIESMDLADFLKTALT